jgi:hypothetical protein
LIRRRDHIRRHPRADQLFIEYNEVIVAYDRSFNFKISVEDAEPYLANLRFQGKCWERKAEILARIVKLLK